MVLYIAATLHIMPTFTRRVLCCHRDRLCAVGLAEEQIREIQQYKHIYLVLFLGLGVTTPTANAQNHNPRKEKEFCAKRVIRGRQLECV